MLKIAYTGAIVLFAVCAGYLFAFGMMDTTEETNASGYGVSPLLKTYSALNKIASLEKQVIALAAELAKIKNNQFPQQALAKQADFDAPIGTEEYDINRENFADYDRVEEPIAERTTVELKKEFWQEPLDEKRTSQFEAKLGDAVRRFNQDSLIFESLECRETGCMLEISGDSGDAATNIVPYLATLGKLPEEILISPPSTEEGSTTTKIFLVY